jgi:hypothetical protein
MIPRDFRKIVMARAPLPPFPRSPTGTRAPLGSRKKSQKTKVQLTYSNQPRIGNECVKFKQASLGSSGSKTPGTQSFLPLHQTVLLAIQGIPAIVGEVADHPVKQEI